MRRRMRIICIAFAAGLCAAGAAQAAGDPRVGKAKSQTCTACHGADGRGISPQYPILAGQHADYLVHALKQYRDGNRKNPIMAPMAAQLSDDDIEDLAAYYADMDPALSTPEP